MFLTPDEICELTGRKYRSAQADALHFMGIEHRVRPDGSIAVLKSHVESVFSGKPEPKKPAGYESYRMPDFSKVA